MDWFLYDDGLRHERVNKLQLHARALIINPLHASVSLI